MAELNSSSGKGAVEHFTAKKLHGTEKLK